MSHVHVTHVAAIFGLKVHPPSTWCRRPVFVLPRVDDDDCCEEFCQTWCWQSSKLASAVATSWQALAAAKIFTSKQLLFSKEPCKGHLKKICEEKGWSGSMIKKGRRLLLRQRPCRLFRPLSLKNLDPWLLRPENRRLLRPSRWLLQPDINEKFIAHLGHTGAICETRLQDWKDSFAAARGYFSFVMLGFDQHWGTSWCMDTGKLI